LRTFLKKLKKPSILAKRSERVETKKLFPNVSAKKLSGTIFI